MHSYANVVIIIITLLGNSVGTIQFSRKHQKNANYRKKHSSVRTQAPVTVLNLPVPRLKRVNAEHTTSVKEPHIQNTLTQQIDNLKSPIIYQYIIVMHTNPHALSSLYEPKKAPMSIYSILYNCRTSNNGAYYTRVCVGYKSKYAVQIALNSKCLSNARKCIRYRFWTLMYCFRKVHNIYKMIYIYICTVEYTKLR